MYSHTKKATYTTFKLHSNTTYNLDGEKSNFAFAHGKDELTGKHILGTTTLSCQYGLAFMLHMPQATLTPGLGKRRRT